MARHGAGLADVPEESAVGAEHVDRGARERSDCLVGCLLGAAVGDAIGLPYEGLSRRRGARLLGPPDRHRLLPGRGMVSDDTEHACMVAQSLIASGDPAGFARELGRRLRVWLLGLPAGAGLATLRAAVRLWLGVPPDRSGVRSAGNGPAMRAAILGVSIDGLDSLEEYVRVSSRVTHTDPRAEYGALAVALAARMAAHGAEVHPREYSELLASRLRGRAEELLGAIERAVVSVERGESTHEFAAALGLAGGVTGYVNHTVPVAVHAWLRSQRDLRAAVEDVVACGGDADSTAAVVGGIVGAGVGRAGIPADWLSGLWDWPASREWLERLGAQLAERRGPRPAVSLPFLAVLARNIVFLLVVLAHGFRRLLPPY